MIVLIQNLVESLREELKQYGEMLALLEQQQEMVLQRQTQDLLQNVAAVNAQGGAIQAARRDRQQIQRHLSQVLLQKEEAAFKELIPLLPADYRPLVQALVEENNDLLENVQHKARQNHLLLSRALDLMQRFLTNMFPTGGSPVYSGGGQIISPLIVRQSLYEAVG